MEYADGKDLPYEGFIEVDLEIQGISESIEALLLIVPEIQYNSRIPLLLGTNILNSLIDHGNETYGERYLQLSNFTAPWYLLFRAMHLTDRELRRNYNRIGLVRSAENGIIRIPPNTYMVIQGYIAQTIHTIILMLY